MRKSNSRPKHFLECVVRMDDQIDGHMGVYVNVESVGGLFLGMQFGFGCGLIDDSCIGLFDNALEGLSEET